MKLVITSALCCALLVGCGGEIPEEDGERGAAWHISGYSPIGWLDRVSRSGVASGWSCDKDDPHASIRVHLYVGGPAGKGKGHSIAANKGHEVAVSNACNGGRAHRFSFQIPNYRGQLVYAYGINISGTNGRNRHLSGSPKAGNTRPIGWLDAVKPGGVAVGWACDRDAPRTQIRVHLYVGGPAGKGKGHSIAANKSSESAVKARCGGGDAHRFSFTIPNYRAGQPVYAYGIDDRGTLNAHLSGSPKAAKTPKNICSGICGKQAPQGCYCDKTCFQSRDCCGNASGGFSADLNYVMQVCKF